MGIGKASFFLLLCSFSEKAFAVPESPTIIAVETISKVNNAVNNPTVECYASPPEKNDRVLNKCIANPNVADGIWKYINFKTEDSCTYNRVNYSIRKNKDIIEIKMSLDFDYQGRLFNRKNTLDRLDRVLQCIVKFYQRFGLNLKFESKVFSKGSAPNGVTNIHLWDDFEVYDSENWAMLKTQSVQMSEDQACGNYAHEIGHRLGLPDRYSEAGCPERVIGAVDDVMRSGGWKGTEKVKLYHKDVESIIKPLCGR